MRRFLIAVALGACLLPLESSARIGGGSSYSGSRSSGSSGGSRSSSSGGSRSWSSSSSSSSSTHWSSSGGSGGGGSMSEGEAWVLLFLLVGVVLFVKVLGSFSNNGRSQYSSQRTSPSEADRPTASSVPQSVSISRRLRGFDKTFSEPVFLEWATLLYVRANEARGGRDFDVLTPYFTPDALDSLKALDRKQPITDVKGVIVGSVKLVDLVVEGSNLNVLVAFHANCTVVGQAGREQAYYAHEQWTFTRARSATSRTPATIERMGCPTCGSPVERTALDRCVHCGTAYQPGTVDFCVSNIDVQELETRPPLLTGEVEEVGTNLPSVRSPGLTQQLGVLQKSDPDFSMQAFQAQARRIFMTLQEGWTQQKWEALRPNETDAVFQSHRFWLEEYRRQGLRNVLEDVQLTRIDPVKVDLDAHYEAITCRMYARMRDSTIKVSSGQVVGGNARKTRVFTEYWTFIRRRGLHTRPAGEGPKDSPTQAASAPKCPNCGAPLTISQAGICESCEAKVTLGEFGWVLSRIEQDEEYSG